jgi:hypothetical protein
MCKCANVQMCKYANLQNREHRPVGPGGMSAVMLAEGNFRTILIPPDSGCGYLYAVFQNQTGEANSLHPVKTFRRTQIARFYPSHIDDNFLQHYTGIYHPNFECMIARHID